MYRAVPVMGLLALAVVFGACSTEEPEQTLPKPAVVNFLASPAEIEAGRETKLSWETKDAVSVRIENGSGVVAERSGAEALIGSVGVKPTIDTTYTLTATGQGGTATSTTSVTVQQPPAAPMIHSFTVTPGQVAGGANVTFAWETMGAETVTIRNSDGAELDLGGAAAAQGAVVHAADRDDVFTLKATGPGGSITAEASVDVVAPPRVTFVATQTTIDPGAASKLTWTVTDATEVKVEDASGTVLHDGSAATGEVSVTPARTTSYQITARGIGGETTAETIIAVRPVIDLFEITTAGPVRAGEPVEMRWAVRGATSVQISQPGLTLHESGDDAGTLTANVGPEGSFQLVARSGNLEVIQSATIAITTLPKIRAFAIDQAEVSARHDLPATVELSWAIDGAADIDIEATPGGFVDLTGQSTRADSIAVPVTESTTYKITARNQDGSVEAQQSVLVHMASRVVSFDVRPLRVGSGEIVNLGWETDDAVSIRLEKDGVDLGVAGTTVDGGTTDTLTADATYVLRSFNSVGFEVASEPVAVSVGAPLISSFSASQPVVPATTDLTFTWANLGGTRLWIVDDFDGTVFCETTSLYEIPAGSCTISAPVIDAMHTFTVHVSNGDGEDTRSVDVRIVGGPVVNSFTASRPMLTIGETVDFTWDVANDAQGRTPTLTLTDDMGNVYDVSAANPNTATVTITPLSAGATTFTLLAQTPDTTDSSAAVPVATYAVPVIDSLAFNPPVVDTQGGTVPSSTTLSWATQHGVTLNVYQLDGDGVWILPAAYSTSDVGLVAAGSYVLAPPAGTITYEVEVINPAGWITEGTISVEVDPVEITSFGTASPDIVLGSTATLDWTTNRAATVTLAPRVAKATPVSNGFTNINGAAGVQTVAITAGTATNDTAKGDIVFPSTFTFPWYGSNKTGARVAAAGWLSFNMSNTSGGGTGSDLPNSSYSYVHLAPFWDSNRLGSSGSILYLFGTDASGDYLIVQWNDIEFVTTSDNPASLNFQIVLRENGSFEYHYGTMTSADPSRHNGSQAYITYQNEAATVGGTLGDNEEIPNGLTNKGWVFSFDYPTNGSWDVKPYKNTAYTLNANNAHSSDSAGPVEIRVWSPVHIDVASISAEPEIGTPFTVSYTTDYATEVRVEDSTGAVRCTSTPASMGTNKAGSCQITETAVGTYAYTVRAVGGFEANAATWIVNTQVYNPISIDSFTSNVATSILVGESATLTWATTGAATISLEANGVPLDLTGKSITADSIVHTPSSSTFYDLTITESGRVRTQRVAVTVRTAGISSWSVPSQAPAGPGGLNTTLTSIGAESVWFSAAPPAAGVQVTDGSAPYIDLAGRSTAYQINLTGKTSTDELPITFPDGFTFPFTGTIQSGAVVALSGFISFNPASAVTSSNVDLPYTTTTHFAHMMPFWDSVMPQTTGTIWYEVLTDTQGRYLVIQWKNFQFGTTSYNPADLNFEIILRENGKFEFRYGTMTNAPTTPTTTNVLMPDGYSATIGYQDLAGKSRLLQTDPTTGAEDYNNPITGGLTNKAWRFDPNVPANGTVTGGIDEDGSVRICVANAGYIECRDSGPIKLVRRGDVMITEIMHTPASPQTDPDGEWFEIRNLADFSIDVNGWVIASGGGDAGATIANGGPLVLASGQIATFARGGSAAAGFLPTYSYGSGVTIDSADTLSLVYGPLTIDTVTWDSTWPIVTGQSLSLDGSGHLRELPTSSTPLMPNRNDTTAYWCQGTSAYVTGNLGSPGTVGAGCKSTYYDIDPYYPATFMDISTSTNATRLNGPSGGNAVEQVSGGIGFSMPWFGGSVTDLWVSSEGHVAFSTITVDATNDQLPTTATPNDMVAVFWDSLGESAVGAASVHTELRTIGLSSVRIVQWTSFDSTTYAGELTFQVQLWSNGDIVTMVQEAETTSTSSSAPAYYRGSVATFGLENASGTEAALYTYNKDNATYPGRAILYKKK